MAHIKTISVSDVSTIIIEPVSESDSGNYTCKAVSEGMTDMFIAPLNIYGKSLIYIYIHLCINLIDIVNFKINKVIFNGLIFL